MRLIVDKEGSGQQDLFLKIDNSPAQVFITDSYYLADFLEVSAEEIQMQAPQPATCLLARHLLHHWEKQITSWESQTSLFLPYDIQDEYIGGFLLTEEKKGIQVHYAYTQDLHGYACTAAEIVQAFAQKKIKLETAEPIWLLSQEQVLAGIQWSIGELGS